MSKILFPSLLPKEVMEMLEGGESAHFLEYAGWL